MINPKLLSLNDSEGKLLQKFAAVLTATSPNGVEYNVEDAYFDSSKGWLWTTIMAEYTGENGHYECWQAISPALWEKVILAKPYDLLALAGEYYAGLYCCDKPECLR